MAVERSAPALSRQLLHVGLLLAAAGCGGGGGSQAPDAAFNDVVCSGSTVGELVACVDQARLEADVQIIAQQRVPGSPHWQTVQDLCRSRLEDYGYDVTLEVYDSGVNVVGRLAGSDSAAGQVIVSAHYDHIPGCPGADDNATGLAGALEVARVLADREFSRELVIACWDEEETGLHGSKAFADAAQLAGDQVSLMVSLDGIGYFTSQPNSQQVPDGFDLLFPAAYGELAARDFRGDLILLVGDEASAANTASFKDHGESVGLDSVLFEVPEGIKLADLTGDLRRSDHASFWVHDYPAVMVTDSGNFRNPNYHCRDGVDLPSTVDMGAVAQVTQATVGTAVDALSAL